MHSFKWYLNLQMSDLDSVMAFHKSLEIALKRS